MADNEEIFKEAASNLFGENFEKKMKERAEAVKIQSKSQSQSGISSRLFFFGTATPLEPREVVAPSGAPEAISLQWAHLRSTPKVGAKKEIFSPKGNRRTEAHQETKSEVRDLHNSLKIKKLISYTVPEHLAHLGIVVAGAPEDLWQEN